MFLIDKLCNVLINQHVSGLNYQSNNTNKPVSEILEELLRDVKVNFLINKFLYK
jgi:hypothetical protein